mgnify:CR=1 FL=1
MTLTECLQQIRESRRSGYAFFLATGVRLVPQDEPAGFVFKRVQLVRCAHPDPAEKRDFYPHEAVWHCFLRTPDEPQFPTGFTKVAERLGLSSGRLHKLLAVGEMFHGFDPQLRALLLKAAGLREGEVECLGE